MRKAVDDRRNAPPASSWWAEARGQKVDQGGRVGQLTGSRLGAMHSPTPWLW